MLVIYLQNFITQFFISPFQNLIMADSPISLIKPQNEVHNAQMQSQIIKPSMLQPQIEVQVTTKKKKQIINLQSSEEKELQDNQQSPKKTGSFQSSQDKKIKMKKTTLKCQLCKGSGKKNQMKNCINCKLLFHFNCLQENEVKKKYVCDRCRIDKTYKSKATKKQKKAEEKNQEMDKTTLKKIQKEKKKDECNRTLRIFNQKYLYYVGEDGKIKFPIEDKLLFIYREYFEPTEIKLTPIEHPVIPAKHLSDFLEIQNFLVSFKDELEFIYKGQTRKSVLYLLMNCEGTDQTFENLLAALIKIYLRDIFEKNKTENVKILNDHCFFIILGNLNEMDQLSVEYLSSIAGQIIRYFSNVPSMKKAFENFKFPQRLNIQTKTYVITTIIQGLSEVDGFHDMVSKKSEKMSEMTREKANLGGKLKKHEAEALSNKEKVKEIMIGIADQQNNNKVQQDTKSLKQIQKSKSKTTKMNIQREQTEVTIKDYKEKIGKITRKIPFAISQIMFLGSDRNKSQYFFFLGQPNRIYVRYHNFLLDEACDSKIYEGKEKIVELLKSLNTKGINEKHLHESINSLLKQDTIRNLTVEEKNQEEGSMIFESSKGYCIFGDEQYRTKIIEDILDIEERFSNYLAMKSCQWASPPKRQEFRFGFAYIQDIQAFKEAIKSLQEHFLFVEVIREREIMKEERDYSDSNNEEKDPIIIQRQLSKRKRPIRLWGMNAEKIKRYWGQYLETSISYTGVWICVHLLKNYVNRYLDKKLEVLKEEQKRQQNERQKQMIQYENKMQRQMRQRQRQQQKKRQIQRNPQKKGYLRRHREVSLEELNEQSQPEEEQVIGRRPNLRKSTRIRNKALTIDSDDECEPEEDEEDSNNDDECGVCGQFGDMICCDTCPKVYHIQCLKLKQVPDGQWSCMTCLQRLSNTRQTRSKVKKLSK